jgi:tRNA threonylcarbamoyladenosine biosynthesis protein TsaE
VLLYGEPGTGKTTLIGGIAKGLGFNGRVTSPTFNIVNEYQGRLPLYHIDLYRLESKDIEDIGIDEYLFGKGVCAVEWPSNILWQDNVSVEIILRYLSGEKREVTVNLQLGDIERFREALIENTCD